MAAKRPAFRLKGLKFHIEIGELEVDGTGDESAMPKLQGMVAEKIGHAIQPLTQGLLPGVGVTPPAPASTAVLPVEVEKRPRRPRSPRVANSPSSIDGSALPWKPSSTPDAEWTTAKKALWLLYFYSKEHGGTATAPKGLGAAVVFATYNKHFPFAKPVQSSHVYRDLKKLAARLPPLVTVDQNSNPPTWYIAPAGAALVEEMIKGATAPAASSAA